MTLTPSAIGFAAPAQELVDLLEHGDLTDRDVFDRVHYLLADLYRAALVLPHEAESTQEIDPPSLEDRRAAVFTRVGRAFASRTAYLEVFDPYEEEAPLWASVSDDLSDVFGDLEEGLWHWRAGRPADAVWEWRFGLEHHWGNHFVDVLRALHRIRFSYGLESWGQTDT